MHDIGAFAFSQDLHEAQDSLFQRAVPYPQGAPAELIGVSGETPVLTCDGPIDIQSLKPGARVHTRDHGIQPVLWCGRTDRGATRDLQAVVIPPGALGNPCQLSFAPHQGVLLTDWRASIFFGEPEILIQAKGLNGFSGIHRQTGKRTAFYHILLPQHALIQANGSWTESLHPRDVVPKQFGQAAAFEINALVPAFAAKSVPTVTVSEARALSGSGTSSFR